MIADGLCVGIQGGHPLLIGGRSDGPVIVN